MGGMNWADWGFVTNVTKGWFYEVITKKASAIDVGKAHWKMIDLKHLKVSNQMPPKSSTLKQFTQRKGEQSSSGGLQL